MAYLIDTSLLARLANTADAQYAVAVGAVVELHRRGETLHVTPQVLVEFRSVATRPTDLNGLGLSADDATVQTAGSGRGRSEDDVVSDGLALDPSLLTALRVAKNWGLTRRIAERLSDFDHRSSSMVSWC